MNYVITKSEFNQIKSQTLIIDVRDNWEHQQLKKLPNSVNIPFLELTSEPEKCIRDKNQLVITYCNYGNRSGQATQILREKGYLRAFVLEGGIENYFLKLIKWIRRKNTSLRIPKNFIENYWLKIILVLKMKKT